MIPMFMYGCLSDPAIIFDHALWLRVKSAHGLSLHLLTGFSRDVKIHILQWSLILLHSRPLIFFSYSIVLFFSYHGRQRIYILWFWLQCRIRQRRKTRWYFITAGIFLSGILLLNLRAKNCKVDSRWSHWTVVINATTFTFFYLSTDINWIIRLLGKVLY